MHMAAEMSARLGWLGNAELARIAALLERAGLPVLPPASMNTAQFLDIMAVDKKNIDQRIRLILLRGIGNALITDEFDPAALEATLADMLHRAREAS
jgi:3-dehydroquinate synthase